MPAPNGTCLSRFKRAFIDLLDAQTTKTVAYDSPQSPEDIMGADGSGVAAWFVDEADANHAVGVMKGTPAWWDETIEPVLRIQAIGLVTDDTQETVDGRAEAILGLALAILANDPSVGLTDDTIQEFTAIHAGWKYRGGITAQNQRAASFDLTIEVQARLKLTLS